MFQLIDIAFGPLSRGPGMSQSSLRPSLGAVLVGSVISAFLSGVVSMQVYLYYRTYPEDGRRFKLGVTTIWLLDLLHTGMVCASDWVYLIENFGNDISDNIIWTIAVTVALTAIITFSVHCFFAYRIFTLSRKNYYFTTLIVVVAFARVVLAIVSTVKMIALGSYHDFVHSFGFIFTSGLSLAAVVDGMIAAGLIWYLNRSRTGFSDMDTILDSIKVYTIENGLLTSITTVVSLICWITMPSNLIFLGLHFVISKLYANALMATLNARTVLRGKSQGYNDRGGEYPMPVLFPENYQPAIRPVSRHKMEPLTKVHVTVEKSSDRDSVVDIQHLSGSSHYESPIER
ncbi:hypothetical protein BXZ70DRAFT_1065375 [Cristinia sonorae]|uniref:DUF6534 domain-containing protein n=1 Tax=Cristinia sonorae TaxID=1940300 RepID=A0A8K0UMX9_9AGAR|nr:hypothetical protein BXZ70DRAFT_1065375 [Cristinia sonorae]